MAYNKFRISILIRVSLVFLTLFLSLYLFFSEGFIISSIFLLFISIIQVFLLIHFAEKTNRELARFLNSIQFSDFSQSFVENNYGSSFNELNDAFSNIIGKFANTRSEMEEQAQYLQTVFKNVSTGLISFYGNGDITLVNNAARELLKITDIRNLNQLNAISIEFTESLRSIRSGQRVLKRIYCGDRYLQLSISAAEIKMKGIIHKLVSIQDISSELERERLHNEVEIARSVHMRLLPEIFPHIPGYSLSAQCLPAFEVGGDYFDFIKIDKNNTGIVIADVSGKGLPAAIYMTLTKGIFQSHAGKSTSPREVLIHLNEIIYRTIERGSFITMFYGIINSANDTFTYARAGHDPVIMCAKNGRSKLLKPGGMAIGLENGEIFSRTTEEETITVAKGDMLFFYTDGFTEAKNKLNEDFGLNNLINVISGNISKSHDDLIKKIRNKTDEFRQDILQYDDMTYIALTKTE